ncbi:MAG: Na+/H+ antiporter subunit G [Flavobacteriaceae bacterium CG_4_8_14_3_um_filter_34_10]|nr:monovalent cation/H(+) antiporter subunit G [Flavobacteriia bacterium]OIP51325.1 MAG: Na+/H+ antiporter subunit G [Flavobacteriaceae bacterium CG2_30_34_30]PIQ17857.1 MAG: Na+/H+ antiporter subunit G [Flavobacteriaceae bacterium CG18_big_fil_WC_8_21_14_2_50_34_36]PIV51260.1 MAG: Na+/H+ antiporter subunit G [Flavobacteriaceae bacterium CG02_land_8_20_14_3_00_34_13]PIX08384.1 MAG: Na+/H+ antiporter subunit G [Flavobacteriaceae bacterium CG_4_8_14_3_um_filter_34_10]PIZ07494.1 MAG: Na+/H+ antip
MSDVLIAIFATLGTIFVFLAAVGLVRMPDTYLRISVTTKAATLGIGLILIAAAIYFNELSITSRVLAIILFIFLTAPVGAHLIGRASYFTGVKLWKKSVMDDLEGKYKKTTHKLSSEDSNEKQEDVKK